MREIVLCGLLLILAADQAHAASGDVPVGRYSVVAPVPRTDQSDPLETIVRLSFPPYVKDVGGAVDYLLARSGFRLADALAAGEAQLILLRRPLPESQRTLGPMPLRRALETLGGEAFWLIEDPVHRLVAFDVADDYRPLLRGAPVAIHQTVAPAAGAPTILPLAERAEPPIEMLVSPVNRIDGARSAPASYGPTTRGETLGSITQILVPDQSHILAQRMLAIIGHNPQAFGKLDGAPNMNLIHVDAVLTAPDADEIGRVSPDEARREVARHHQAWEKAILKGAAK